MRVVLNPTLEVIEHRARINDADIQRFCDRLSDSLKSKFIGIDLNDGFENLHLGYVGLLSEAYNRHEKVRLAPHDLWFIFLTELAKLVNKNSEACRPLFTRSDEKIEILVQTDDPTAINPQLIMDQLEALVPIDTLAFMPPLSTMNLDVRLAMQATFADMVQQYYNYMTFMCGIREIHVTGTPTDWNALVECCVKLKALFISVNLLRVAGYIDEVREIFSTIALYKIGARTSLEFWEDIFTKKNIGSGGDYEINGWITKLFYEQRHVRKLENFTSTYGVLPYKNIESGRKFKAAHGAFAQHRDENGFIYAQYTRIVFEDLS